MIKQLTKYFYFQIIHSMYLNIFFLLGCILPIPLIISVYFATNLPIIYSSFIFLIIFFSFNVIYSFLLIIKLFLNNKYNFVDSKLISQSYSRSGIFLSKILLVFSFITVLNFLIFVISGLTFLSVGANGNFIGASIVSNWIGSIINSLFIIPFFTCMVMIFSRIVFSVLSTGVISIIIFSSIATNLFLVNSNLNNDLSLNTNQNNVGVGYAKISKIDENNKLIESKYVAKLNLINPDKNLNTDIKNSINNINVYSNLMPGNLLSASQQLIFNKIYNYTFDDLKNYMSYMGSINRFTLTNIRPITSFLQQNYSYIIQNALDPSLLSNEYFYSNELIYQSYNQIISDSKYRDLFVKDYKLFSKLNDFITNNKYWYSSLDNLTLSELEFFFELIGNNNPSLFYTWYYFPYLFGNFGSFFNQIEGIYGRDFKNLIFNLYKNNNVYENLLVIGLPDIALSNDKLKLLKKFINYVNEYYYVTNNNNVNLPASINDKNFVCNILVKFDEENSEIVKLLNKDLSYSDFNFNILNSLNVNNQHDWTNLINNTKTVNELKSIYNKLKENNGDLFDYRFSNSDFNNYSFDYCFDIELSPYLTEPISSIIIQLFFSILLINISLILFNRQRISQ